MNPEWTNFAFAFVIHVLITSHHAMLTQGTCFIFSLQRMNRPRLLVT